MSRFVQASWWAKGFGFWFLVKGGVVCLIVMEMVHHLVGRSLRARLLQELMGVACTLDTGYPMMPSMQMVATYRSPIEMAVSSISGPS
jgi:hypothetical protein